MKKKEKQTLQTKNKIRDLINKIKQWNSYFLLIPLTTILIYNLLFFNRFYPFTEGWFSEYAWLMNHGQFPYKDFYFFLTPFYLNIMSTFTAIFGYSILYLRILGLFVILLMAYFLYKNIEIIFGSAIAAFVSIVGIIYYQSNNAHIPYDFIQFVTLFGLIQSYLLLKYTTLSGQLTKQSRNLLLLAGFFSGLMFLTKQSNGTMITIFSFVGLVIASSFKGWKEALKAPVCYIGGLCLPVVLTIVWIFINGAFPQFHAQIFSDAIGAKGGLMQIFFSWFAGILTENFVARLKEIVIIFFIFGYWFYIFRKNPIGKTTINKMFLLIVSFGMILVILLPLYLHRSAVAKLSHLGLSGINNIIVAAIAIPIIVLLVTVIRLMLKKTINEKAVVFSFVALGFIYGTGTSAGVTEVGAFAGFCLFISLMLYHRSFFGLGKIFIVLFCMSYCLMLVETKYESPYYWWNVTSPDIRAKLYTTNKLPILHRLYTSKDNIQLLEQVTTQIESHSKPSDPILLFPNIPVFYLLADRKPPGKAIVHWFDFLSDDLAIKEAGVIKKNPPKVIVYLDLGPTVWEAHERLFRNGKPSGQRKVDQAIKDVIKSQKMHISKKYWLDKGAVLNVWTK